ncbi:hypothetical protein L2E82_41202 [Cichorium intybus]|uniref:Uncharacterized protein n=1 Tax=Cichorium intybus TaxID=13427 RepID=A0ACB9AS34_CICIN|nr:hypothetical protein L2E82_41202 [Cichorium intybus]
MQAAVEQRHRKKIVMEIENILHMNVGNGESSYASNSFLQETAIRKTLPVLKRTIKGMVNHDVDFSKCFVLADLGCGTGTNALMLASMVIDIVIELCKEYNHKAPQLQVPEGIENNKGNIFMAKTSPLNVFEAYRKQFHTDFINFLQLRSKEIVRGGCMVLTFLGRNSSDPTTDDCCRFFELLAQSLLCMVKEGMVEESYIHSFNLPCYTPCEDEVRNAIHNDGSFSLDTFNVFQGNWDPYDTDYTNTVDLYEQSYIHGKNCAKVIRAVTEPLLISHFGNSINIDVLFQKFEMQVAKDLAKKKTRYFNMVVSLSRK